MSLVAPAPGDLAQDHPAEASDVETSRPPRDTKAATRRDHLIPAGAVDGLSLTIEHPTAAHTVVRVAGEIDMLTGPGLQACLMEHLAARPQQLVLDLAEVTFLGSHALAILVGAKTTAEKEGTPLYLTGHNTRVQRLLDVTGLTATFREAPSTPGPRIS